MYFGFCIVTKGYRNSSEKAVSYFIIKWVASLASLALLARVLTYQLPVEIKYPVILRKKH